MTTRPLHVLEVFQPDIGGVPVYAANLAEGLIASGWNVSVACPPDARVCKNLHAAGVEVLPLEVARSPHLRQDARAVRRLVRWCRARDVSLIHAHSTKAGALAALAARTAGVPSVYTPHGWAFEMQVSPPLRAAYALVERELTSRCHAAVISVSASGRAAAERWRVTPRGRIQVIRTGLPVPPVIGRSSARRALGLRQDAVVAAWVGRASAQKRPQDLAPIARRLAGEVTVIALCDGMQGTTLAHELGDAGVVVAGPGCDPATIYASADILLHTSQWEGLPLVVLEAMSAGLPVLAYSVGGVPEQVQPGRTGYLVEPGDVEMMCECVLALVRNPVVRTRMGQAGRSRVARLFSYNAMLEHVMRTYRSVAAPSVEEATPETAVEPTPRDILDGLLRRVGTGGLAPFRGENTE